MKRLLCFSPVLRQSLLFNNYVRVYSVLNLSHVDKCHTHVSIPYPYYRHMYKTIAMNETFLSDPLIWRITVCRAKLDSSRWTMWCPPLICTPKQITFSSPWLSWWFQFRHIPIHDTIQYHVLYRYIKCGQHLHSFVNFIGLGHVNEVHELQCLWR